ncbi:hypothetical protein NUV89_07530 [Pseudomonas sp. 18.1.10]|uniref:hypothetical protein n=1 Tax=Pseudomonas sp. 18.1.10 TaxID=2969302 RepID=UPI00214F63A1|nr:hypothetical protein [Pseudomonas sp. 18.1.10]MCR4538241.1 hypothetical protein [Pseudomonas sp. 18.1.10]
MSSTGPVPLMSSRKVWLASCTFLFITVLIAFVSFAPRMPENGLDPSWAWAISHAVDTGVSLGKDIIFTYGPLANVYTWMYSSVYGGLYFILSLYLAVAMSFGLWSLFVDKRRAIPVIVLAIIFAWFGDRKDAFYMVLPVVALFNLIGSNLEGEKFKGRRLYAFIALLPAFGILPLIKLSFSVICGFSALIGILLLVRQREYKVIPAVILMPIVTLVGLWVLVGQELTELPLYIVNALPIISGYTEAMAIYGSLLLPAVALVGSVAVLYGVFSTTRLPKLLAVAAAILGAAYLFLLFKAGFVRQDTHPAMTGIGIMILALLAWPMTHSLRTLGTATIAIVAGSAVAFVSLSSHPVGVTSYFFWRAEASLNGILIRVLDPDVFAADFKAAKQAIAASDPIPKLAGSTDIYSYGQAALLASDNEWLPRPIFQSYSAYTPVLLEKNADFLQSNRAPKNIVFNIETIDGRMPSQEDGASWPALFQQYEPQAVAGQRIVLSRNSNPAPTLVDLGQIDTRMGQPVNIPEFDGQVYMTAKVRPSVLGKLKSLLFKPSYLLSRVTLKSGQAFEYRVISGMMQTPFLVSPLVESSKEFLSMYVSADFIDVKKVDSITIYSKQVNDRGWLDAVTINFYGMKNPQSERAGQLLNIVKLNASAQPAQAECVGSLDAINGGPVLNGVVKVKNFISIRGWNAEKVDSNMDQIQRVVFIEGDKGLLMANVNSEARADVAVHFNAPQMLRSGYTSYIDVTDLQGRYQLTTGMLRNGHVIRCPQPPVEIFVR